MSNSTSTEAAATGLILSPSRNGAIAVYEGMADKLAAIKEIGDIYWKAGVAGIKTREQGQCLALVCMAKGIDPFAFAEEHHLVDGKPTVKAHTILKRIRAAGHDVEWKSDLDAADKAEAMFTIGGRKTTVRYSIEDAQRSVSGFAKEGSNWQKTPAAMLRAAVLRKGATALCPEVLTGDADSEEFAEAPRNGSAAVVSAMPVPSAADADARRREIQAMQSGAPAATEQVIEASAEPVAPDAEAVPFTVPDRPAADEPAADQPSDDRPSDDYTRLTAILLEIEAVAGQVGMSRATLEQKLAAANPSFIGLEKLEIPAAEQLLQNLKAKVAAAAAGK